ncbi:MAG TPA: sulfite exporter TauE/SafE family protein [Candidatus Saccharimonadales bacterium]|nr:sulfite exporter TauE/SafE family protein [Candidatus Saccharimonadales bacterium]
MDTEKLIVFGTVSFLMSIISAIGGGGGGFITTPLAIFLGLTPQQAIATGKVGGLGTTSGSLEGLTKVKIYRWNKVIPLMALAAIVGLTAPFVIKNLDNDIYRRLIGAMLILLIPVIWYRKIGVQEQKPAAWHRIVAIPLLVATMFMQAIFSSGMGSLVVLVLMGLMGMKALEANVTKRFSQVILNSLLVLGLIGSKLILWNVALVIFVGNIVGSSIGSRIALRKGDKFVTQVFIILMLVSGLILIFGGNT